MGKDSLCPKFEKTMVLLGKRWTFLLVHKLSFGTYRFSELENALPISGRLLSERLKELEKEEIVIRTVYPETPVRIEYSLSEKGMELATFINAMDDWAQKWM